MTELIPELWVTAFSRECQGLWGLTLKDTGLSDEELAEYMDLDPEEAALVWGEDNNLVRIDRGWF